MLYEHRFNFFLSFLLPFLPSFLVALHTYTCIRTCVRCKLAKIKQPAAAWQYQATDNELARVPCHVRSCAARDRRRGAAAAVDDNEFENQNVRVHAAFGLRRASETWQLGVTSTRSERIRVGCRTNSRS